MVFHDGQKVAVVTGGTGGVGRATVREFASRGYDVAILARGAAGLEGAAADVRKVGQQALPVAVDVADHDAVRQAAATVESELGEISVWVNVAFAGSLAFSWDTPMAEFRRMTEVTYYGQVHGTMAALERMRPRDRGVIVNVGSAMAYRSIPLQAPYCGAKHAVKGFTESVMCELAHEKSKVKLCMVQLPGLNTTQFRWNLNKMPHHPMPVPRSSSRSCPRGRSPIWPSIPGATCGSGCPPPTPSSGSGWPRNCSTSTSAEPESNPSRQTGTCRAWAPTSSSLAMRTKIRAPTVGSTIWPMPVTRSCGCRCTAGRSWPAWGRPPRWQAASGHGADNRHCAGDPAGIVMPSVRARRGAAVPGARPASRPAGPAAPVTRPAPRALLAAARPAPASAAAMRASRIAGRRQRGEIIPRASIVAACVASASAPSARTVPGG